MYMHLGYSAGTFFLYKKMSHLPILAKSNFFVSIKFYGAKIENNRRWQNLDPTHSQKRDVIIFTISETS